MRRTRNGRRGRCKLVLRLLPLCSSSCSSPAAAAAAAALLSLCWFAAAAALNGPAPGRLPRRKGHSGPRSGKPHEAESAAAAAARFAAAAAAAARIVQTAAGGTVGEAACGRGGGVGAKRLRSDLCTGVMWELDASLQARFVEEQAGAKNKVIFIGIVPSTRTFQDLLSQTLRAVTH